MSIISDNTKRIMEEVALAAEKSGRDRTEVQILAASKYTDRAGVVELLNSGITLIGENRVQDAMAKLGGSDDGSQKNIHDEFPDCRIHLIGNLQTNKVNPALRLFDLIETVDRVSLADALEKRLDSCNRILPVLVEVKLTDEETKTGCPIDKVPEFLNYVWSMCPHLEVRGLMGMGPWDPDPEVARPYYRKLKEIFERSKANSPSAGIFRTISMGMSADFHVAIQEGATIVRIGRALFGQI